MSRKKQLVVKLVGKFMRVMVKIGFTLLDAFSTFASDSRIKRSEQNIKKPSRKYSC
ncbi:hypothetical protein [Legionella impletisoli]|uniref:Uncharacterized protein n=1 Tax=Legionella impletisoli TaxID=343510 RepID=A0A917N8X9_9GAMM|nr:hypothetical protein [Legionella impletisoli]GGI77713.1 hypothetical protein GCM10007966_02950 [Legionella impletisoli]